MKSCHIEKISHAPLFTYYLLYDKAGGEEITLSSLSFSTVRERDQLDPLAI